MLGRVSTRLRRSVRVTIFRKQEPKWTCRGRNASAVERHLSPARVSTIDQDLDLQLAKLKAEGCAIVRSEKVSGGSREGRAELATVLAFLRSGDELVVTWLDRLGRDTRDVLNLIHEREQREAFVTVLDPHVSTRGEMGHVVMAVLGMVAQMERRFIKERQRDGIQQAKATGVYQGGSAGSTAIGSCRCTATG